MSPRSLFWTRLPAGTLAGFRTSGCPRAAVGVTSADDPLARGTIARIVALAILGPRPLRSPHRDRHNFAGGAGRSLRAWAGQGCRGSRDHSSSSSIEWGSLPSLYENFARIGLGGQHPSSPCYWASAGSATTSPTSASSLRVVHPTLHQLVLVNLPLGTQHLVLMVSATAPVVTSASGRAGMLLTDTRCPSGGQRPGTP